MIRLTSKLRRKKGNPMTDAEAVIENQKEIRRLRGVVREQERLYSGIHLINVQAKPAAFGRPIGEVMDEMWVKALDLKVDELSFIFSGHTNTIKQNMNKEVNK
jgi:hypothetical protein